MGDGHLEARITTGIRIGGVVARSGIVNHLTVGLHVIRIHEVLCGAVATLCTGVAHGEVVVLERVGSSRTTGEDNLLGSLRVGVELV